MKRKIFSALLMGAFVFAATSTVTSCKDYDDDINSLQSQIDALSKKIDDINTQITNGAILTDVSSISNGVKISLSNGKSYEITNGKDGKDGTAWSISEDGYWVKDGTKTEYKAVPADGKDGKDGKDGAYYVPNEKTGNFDKVDAEGNTTDSGISWKTGVVTGVLDKTANTLTLYGIPDKDGVVSESGVVINLNSRLASLVFEGDECVDGEYNTTYATDAAGLPLVRIGAFYYNSQKLDKKDTSTEKSVDAKKATDKKYNGKANTDSIGYKTYAYYHVSPANVNVDDLKNLAFCLQADAQLGTRTDAKSDNLQANAEFVSFDSEHGVVKVLVKTLGEPATGKYLSTIKLQATKDNNETVTSDAAVLARKNIQNLELVDKQQYAATKSVDYHYRNAVYGISANDYNHAGAAVNDFAVWGQNGIDLKVAVGETIDLNDYVGIHEYASVSNKKPVGCAAFDADRLGLSVSYELVKGFELGSNKTDQANFLNLSGSEITPKVYETTGEAAEGRMPIIRATLKAEDGSIIEVAYIHVQIVAAKLAPKAIEITPEDGVFKFSCDGAKQTTTVKQMNVEVYNAVGLSYNDFYSTYDAEMEEDGVTFKTAKGNVGTVKLLDQNVDGTRTKLLAWTLSADEMWANAGKEVKYVITYKSNSTKKEALTLTLKATVSEDGIVKSKDFTTADRISSYWKSDVAQFNVKTPAQGEIGGSTPGSTCTFINNLNAPFITKDGKLEFGGSTESYSFYFCKDNEGETTVGGVKVKYSLDETKTTLKAQLRDAQDKNWESATDVLVINNADATLYNSVTVQNNDVAKTLLNTGALTAKIGVNAVSCASDEDGKIAVPVTFNGEDHFTALFRQPLTVATKAADSFTDGVNFGNAGSWIKLKDVVTPTDWRGYTFTGTNEFLWKYYGVESIDVAVEKITCNITGTEAALPATVTVKKYLNADAVNVDYAEFKGFWDGKTYTTDSNGKETTTPSYTTDDLGFLTYHNNGTTVMENDFELYVPATITYKWGTTATVKITIPVNKTPLAAGTAKKH